MREKIANLIDVKSLVTLTLILILAFVVVFYVVTNTMNDNVFLLFSNVVTMVVTYFFTKDKRGNGSQTTVTETITEEVSVRQ